LAIRHKRKSTTAYTWLNTDLVDGQIGINTVDGTLHVLKTDNSIHDIIGYHAHTHIESEITDLDKYTQTETDALLATKEPTINPKNTAFNLNLGTTGGTVTEGDDPRLSDTRDPNAHAHIISDVTGLQSELDTKISQVAQDLTPELGGTLDTLGNNIAIGNGAGGYEGLLGNLDSGTGCFLSYAIDTTYNPTNGAIFLAPGEVHLSGSTVTLNSLEGTEARQVYCSAGGTLYSVVPPAAGWSVSDTDNGDYPLDTLAQWVKITGLEISTPEDLAANDPVDITVNIHIINNSSSRGGSIDIGVGINGAEPTTGGVNSVIAGDFDNLIPINVSTAVAVERLTGTIFTVFDS